jgi:hypothetical protein
MFMHVTRFDRARPYLLTLTALLVVLYLIGGMSGLRTLRARYRAWTEPPTQAELARAAPDTLPTLSAAAATHTIDGRKIPLSDPATIGEASRIIVAVVALAVVLMFVSAREKVRRV